MTAAALELQVEPALPVAGRNSASAFPAELEPRLSKFQFGLGVQALERQVYSPTHCRGTQAEAASGKLDRRQWPVSQSRTIMISESLGLFQTL